MSAITMMPNQASERKIFVCGFAFSHDLQKVYLLKKNRPDWQAGLLNGLGGLVNRNEVPSDAMSREFSEESGCLTDEKQWHLIDFKGTSSYALSVYTVRLPEGLTPYKTTDEELWSVYWQNYTQRTWEKLGVVDDVPYLISKAYHKLKSL